MNQPETTDHIADEKITLAARWLIETPRHAIAGSVIQEIRSRFQLDLSEAISVIVEAKRLRIEGGEDGP